MIILTLGLPGSGKGTVSRYLKDTYNFEIAATGVMLRTEIFKQTKLGKEIQSAVEKGDLIADDIVNDYIAKQIEVSKDIIIDGYPRNIKQAEHLSEMLEYNGKSIDFVLYFDSDANQDIQRLANRRTCPKCHAIYNLKTAPPKEKNTCDKCGNELIWRSDDRPENLSHKIDLYRQHTKPLKNYYEELGLLKIIDATKPLMDVYYDVLGSSNKFTVRAF